jgi:phage terminase small subunit
MANLTPKQEKFAQKYVETGNASEAYRQSYNAENMKPEVIAVKACELLKSGNVSVKVEELQLAHRERHDVTVDSLTTKASEVFAGAMEAQQYGAARGALDLQAKLHGLITNKQDVKIGMSDERADEILKSVGLLDANQG